MEKDSVAAVGVFSYVLGCVQVYVSSYVRYCVVFSHIFVWSGQNSCACFWILSRQISR